MLKLKTVAGLLALGLSGPAFAVSTATNPVADWNEITMTAVTAQRPGPSGMLDVALVQVAVHDAVQSLENRFEPYHVEIKNAKGSRTAAVAAAAHDVLIGISTDPTQIANIDAAYYSYLANHGLNGDPGLAVGQAVAARILPLRRANPNPAPAPFVGGNEIGQWRPTPSHLPGAPVAFSSMAVSWLGSTDPFTLTGPSRFRADPPPAVTSDQYTKDYDEVKAVGAMNSTTRTAEQTDIAYFYNDNFFAQWNRVLRSVSKQYLHSTGDSARLFALANMAAVDSLITSWDAKKHYAFWRPVTAIQEGDNDGNPATIGDAAWQPLINTPNYPDYTSGANNFVGAMTRTLQLFFGTDHKTFEVTTSTPQAVKKSRVYRRFSDASRDVVDARIYLGIHFRFADTAARTQGRQVADNAFKHYLQPKGRKGGWDRAHLVEPVNE